VVKKADIGGKRLVGLSPDAWVQWVTGQPDLVAQEIIGSDFLWISRENEVLVRRAVQLLQQDPRLNELESLLGFFASFVLEG
jgi:hypothetical protein